MKLHVPLKIPLIDLISWPANPSLQRLMMGMAPPTEPSNLMMLPFFFASSISLQNSNASGPLLTVITSFPFSRADVMFFRPSPPSSMFVGVHSMRRS